ncbi:MAG: hypothetical protein ACLGPL_12610 [Acidobacteriota bacterium]
MREFIALLIFFSFSGLAVYLMVKKITGNTMTVILLTFSIFAGLAAANYDWLQRARWEVPGFDNYQAQICAVRDKALEEVQKEAEGQKQSLSRLTAGATETDARMDAQRKTIESLIESLARSEERIREQEQRLKDIGNRAEQTRDQVASIHRSSSALALSLTRVAWLLVQAQEEAGNDRGEAAVGKLLNELDAIVNLVITDPKARTEFIAEVMGQQAAPHQ